MLKELANPDRKGDGTVTRESRTGTYYFSRHAIERLIERNLSIETVCKALDNGRKFLTNHGIRVVLGQLTVILSRNGQYVVTMYETLPMAGYRDASSSPLSRRIIVNNRR